MVVESCCYTHKKIVQTLDLMNNPLDAAANTGHVDQEPDEDALR